jgi:predicted nucleic acid-binding Zn ribbon protein
MTKTTLPRRRGNRPRTSGPAPNIQLDQLGSSELHEQLKARFYALSDVEERQTMVSDPRARAMWL